MDVDKIDLIAALRKYARAEEEVTRAHEAVVKMSATAATASEEAAKLVIKNGLDSFFFEGRMFHLSSNPDEPATLRSYRVSCVTAAVGQDVSK